MHTKVLIVRGQNSGLYAEQYRQYYGIFRVERADRPNMTGDSVLVQIAENCTQEDAQDLVNAYNALAGLNPDKIPGLIKALQTISNFSKCQCRDTHGDNLNCCILVAEQALKNVKEE